MEKRRSSNSKKRSSEIGEVSKKSIEIARKLFDKHASNPVQIETIHGFCNKILLQFPLESKTNPFFSIIDESTDDLIKKEAIHLCLKNNKTAKILQLIPEYIFDDLIDCLIENIDFLSSDYQNLIAKLKKNYI